MTLGRRPKLGMTLFNLFKKPDPIFADPEMQKALERGAKLFEKLELEAPVAKPNPDGSPTLSELTLEELRVANAVMNAVQARFDSLTAYMKAWTQMEIKRALEKKEENEIS
jgi:hypothetical protein